MERARFATEITGVFDEELHQIAKADIPAERRAGLARRIDRPIVLVGMMGVGKTTVGRKLAGALGMPFLDADEEIERAAQMTNWNYYEATMRFQRILKAMGIAEALREAGVKEGDNVRIGEAELIWGYTNAFEDE